MFWIIYSNLKMLMYNPMNLYAYSHVTSKLKSFI